MVHRIANVNNTVAALANHQISGSQIPNPAKSIEKALWLA